MVYVIENTAHTGNTCRLFWRPKGHGYTSNLDDAGRFLEAEAQRICENRPEQDVMHLLEDMEALAVRHVRRP